MTVKFKYLLLMIVIGVALSFGWMLLAEPTKAYANTCNRWGAYRNVSWTNSGYRYRLYEIGITAGSNGPSAVEPIIGLNPEAYIRSQNCNTGTYGGAMIGSVDPNFIQRADLIWTDSNLFGWQQDGGNRRIRPDQVQIGLPTSAPNDGTYGGVGRTELNTTADPPLADSNGNLACTFAPNKGIYSITAMTIGGRDGYHCGGRHAAGVDDSGRLVVGGMAGDSTIWCAALNTRQTGENTSSGYDQCNPDIMTTGFIGGPPDPYAYWRNGAAWLLRRDQCLRLDHDELYPPDNADCDAYGSWLSDHNGSPDFSNKIERDSDGYLRRWYNHFDARNTKPGGFGAKNLLTLRYPLNEATCTASVIPVNPAPNSAFTIRLTLTNTGRRPWRFSNGNASSNGYGVENISGLNGTPAYPGGLFTRGESAVIDIDATAPSSSTTTRWRLRQYLQNSVYDNIVNCPNLNISVSNPPVSLTPSATVTLNDTENPTEANLGASYVVATPATITSSVEITREYYVEYYDGRPDLSLGDGERNLTAAEKTNGSHSLATANESLSGLAAGDKVCQKFTIDPGTGLINVATGVISGGSEVSTTVCETVVNKPYLAMYGGDVIAGGAIAGASGCSSSAASSPILTFLREAGRGAGTQLAAFATGAITDFASAKLRSIGTPSRPDGLKFANTPSMGNFGGSNCVTGYAIPATADNTISVNSVGVSTLSSGTYLRSGNLTITSGSIANGRKIVVWVDGNVTITGPMINYASSGGWSNVNQIPSLYVIVSGDIYIDNDVTDLDGVYVAHGTINTCTSGSSQYAVNANFYANCNEQLVVHGSLVANTIKWLRTYGTLREASAGENPYSGTYPKAGELIISGPEMYLAEPALPTITGSGSGTQFQAITSLPPVL